MTDRAVGSALLPLIDTTAFAAHRRPFVILDDYAAGFPGATVTVNADSTKTWPIPTITSLTMLQSWTMVVWRRSRIDLSTSGGSGCPAALGVSLVTRPDDQTQFRFGLVHSKRLAINAYAEKTFREYTLGVGIQSSSDAIIHDVPKATFRWTGVLVPKSTTASAELFMGVNGPGYSCNILSTPQGPDGFRLRVIMDGGGGQPRPLLAVSYPIGGQRRLYWRLRLDSAEVGLSLDPVSNLTVNVGLESNATGLALQLRCRYRLFGLSFPMRIDPNPTELRTVAFCVAIPMVLWGLWQTLPLLADRRRHLARQHRTVAYRDLAVKIEQLRHRRRVALDQQQAMRPEAEARLQAERARGGLVIESAMFVVVGVDGERSFRAQSHGAEFASKLDVRVPLQFWVENSHLTLSTAPKRSMLGFYCPFGPGIERTRLVLIVQYSFAGDRYACEVAECEPLSLPDPARHKAL